MLENFDDKIFYTNDTDLHDIDSDFATFFSDDMDHNTIDLKNINVDDDNFDGDDPTSIVFVRLMD